MNLHQFRTENVHHRMVTEHVGNPHSKFRLHRGRLQYPCPGSPGSTPDHAELWVQSLHATDLLRKREPGC